MEIALIDYCIAVASHISKENRVKYLIECLESLVNQTVSITIYVSISFSNKEIEEYALNEIRKNKIIMNYNYLNVILNKIKTAQMQHYLIIYKEIKTKHKWVMFCDDDDSYNLNRVKEIMIRIAKCEEEIKENKDFTSELGGLYENTTKTNHSVKRQEYWSYCVNIKLLETFYKHIENESEIINNKCCDVLFAEYLRRKSSNWCFIHLDMLLYNYRIEDNAESITGFIKSNQEYYTNQSSPPDVKDEKRLDYILKWNEHLNNNIHIYLHDTYLRTLIGYSLDNILRCEFRSNYQLLEYVDSKHVDKIEKLYNNMRCVCEKIYEIPL